VVFDVIDIDSEEGAAALSAAQVGEWIFGPKVTTGKGHHLYVAVSGEGNRTGLVTGVDYRGRNGYVVAPPSSHPSGREYRWLASMNTPLEPAPKWFVDLLTPERPVVERKAAPIEVSDTYARRAVEKELEVLSGISEGGRNHALNRSAYNLGQLVGSGHLERSAVEAVLTVAALRMGLNEIETAKTIKSGLDKGSLNPRTRSLGQTL